MTTPGRSIPIPQRPGDDSHLPHTSMSTTPGGSKIVYERSFLINMRNSPLARTPPRNLPNIPTLGSWNKSRPVSGG